MATKDGFQPDRSPLFLSEHAENTGQPDIGRGFGPSGYLVANPQDEHFGVNGDSDRYRCSVDRQIRSSSLRTSRLCGPTNRQFSLPADPSTSTTQSVASTQDLPPATATRRRATKLLRLLNLPIRARPRPVKARPEAGQSQAETGQPLTEDLFKQFQAWAAEEDARPKAEPARPAQAAPVQAAQDAPAQVQPTKRHRRARSVQNARAEIRPHRNHRARVREEPNAPVPIAPGTRSPGTGAGCAKYPDTLAPAGPRFALMQRRRNCASPRAAVSKMLADCEVLYTPVFLARAKMTEASCFVGGIRCSRPSNGTPDITRANG